MSEKHLEKGSPLPPKVEGKLRLYSMKFCPFAQRVHLILLFKGLPHDVVNVHLKNKPEWIFNLHPEGKVPALDTGSEVVTESLDVCDFLDEKYLEPPLYPKDKNQRQQDKILMNDFNKLIGAYYKTINEEAKKPYGESIQNLLPHLKNFEDELGRRGLYFGGDKPNMVDYMLWPWGERSSIIKLIFGEQPREEDFPNIYSWCKAMRTQKPVQELEINIKRHYNLYLQYRAGGAVDYDGV